MVIDSSTAADVNTATQVHVATNSQDQRKGNVDGGLREGARRGEGNGGRAGGREKVNSTERDEEISTHTSPSVSSSQERSSSVATDTSTDILAPVMTRSDLTMRLKQPPSPLTHRSSNGPITGRLSPAQAQVHSRSSGSHSQLVGGRGVATEGKPASSSEQQLPTVQALAVLANVSPLC